MEFSNDPGCAAGLVAMGRGTGYYEDWNYRPWKGTIRRAGIGSEVQLTSWQALVWRYFWLPSHFPVPTVQGTLGRTLHSQLGDSGDGAGWSFHRHLGVSENGLVTVSCVFFQKAPSFYTDVGGWMCEGCANECMCESVCECVCEKVCVCGVVSVFLLKNAVMFFMHLNLQWGYILINLL